MGEAKRRAELGKNASMTSSRQALERLNLDTAGKPAHLSLIGAGLMLPAILLGAIMAEEATAERHRLRYAFMIWDRIRTGEYDPWACALCAREHSGLSKMSVLGLVEHAVGS